MKFIFNALTTTVFFSGIFQTIQAWQTSFQLTGKTLVLGNVSYFVSPTPVSQLEIGSLANVSSTLTTTASDFAGEIIPLTVILTSNISFGQSQFEATVNSFKASDDVFSESFLAGVYISFTGNGTPTASTSFASTEFNTSLVLTSPQYAGGIALTTTIPNGPYFLEPGTGNIFEALRLYEDEQQSFVYVKDIYDIQGLHTGCGNRAYYHFYPVKNATAPAVQRLLDGGMILVGKTKTSQFANGEEATEDWVDLHAPYNPRGDGYQDGSSSSTGSGTSIAAYSWLDYAIGTDTGGSVRNPAGVNGAFGNRPSHGAVDLTDVMPLSPELDTGGVFARDAKAWQKVGHWWYQNFTSYPQFPKTILFPTDDYGFGSSFLSNPPAAGTANAIFNDFIVKLEGFLGTNRTEVNFSGLWNTTKPANSTAPSLSVLLNTTYVDLIAIDQLALLGDPFINGFKAIHSGRAPFINPAPLVRWEYARSLPPTQKNEALVNKTIFMNWFAENFVQTDPDSCSESIFLYPQSSGTTTYRNQYGPFAETPDMVVPIGELAYNSTVTNTTEYLPVTMSFIIAKNCDLVLFDLFAALQDAGIIQPVKVGPRVYGTESP
ncbi:hypothetical protein EUX98_g2299 [Antrodiella citrinella]|uniref:Uncharacterized protein n=1 Tax=Antrodiella citrinella TaxID=2447956 RepID=A0A4S4N7K3_9APHY|nr:hypothetical protein EUX98_g2299 [Antrodiella citrinella]